MVCKKKLCIYFTFHFQQCNSAAIMNSHRMFATTSGASFAFFAQNPRPSPKTVEAFAASVNSSSASLSSSRPLERSESNHSCCSIMTPPSPRRRWSEDTINSLVEESPSTTSMEYESLPKINRRRGGGSVTTSTSQSSSSSAQV